MTDVSYLGAGSAEWINWCRAMLALRKTDVENLYELVAAKRGARLKWKTADGEGLTFTKYIGHSKRPDTICWTEMTIADAEELKAGQGKTVDDVLKHVPQNALVAKDDLKKVCQHNGIGKHLVNDLINELVEDELLFEHRIPRKEVKPKVLLGRNQFSIDPALTLDAYQQDSQGHYHIPALPKPKSL
jgi:hypothetical protein